jgi:hypothetical protein
MNRSILKKSSTLRVWCLYSSFVYALGKYICGYKRSQRKKTIIANPAYIIQEKKILLAAENLAESQYMEVSQGRALYWFISRAPIGGTGNNKNIRKISSRDG